MKIYLLILFTSCFYFNGYSQKKYCDDIKKTESELTQTIIYKSNALWFDKNTCLSTYKMITPKVNTLALVLINYANTLSTNLKGVYIKFDDGTFYRNPDLEIGVEVNNSGSRWRYQGLLILNKELIERFKNQKIVSINFGYSGDLTLTNEQSEIINKYVICSLELN